MADELNTAKKDREELTQQITTYETLNAGSLLRKDGAGKTGGQAAPATNNGDWIQTQQDLAVAKAVLEEGIAAKAVDPNKSPFKEMIQQANAKSAGEAAGLDSAAAKGVGASTAKAALAAGDLLYGYGQYAKAAELYRAALTKSGADASLINLHLGMALARSGDKAGATTALNAVTGARAEIAKYWLTYLSTAA
jgi:hypothetical protein